MSDAVLEPESLDLTAPLPLGVWYGEPLDAAGARRLLERVHAERRRAHQRRRGCLNCGPLELIARYWLGRPITAAYETQRGLGLAARERALLELIVGGLLMGRRRRGAMEMLNRGFFAAAPHLKPREYFELLRRHELLAHLPLWDAPAPPQGLASLLTEAAVIRRLRGGTPILPSSAHDDTIG